MYNDSSTSGARRYRLGPLCTAALFCFANVAWAQGNDKAAPPLIPAKTMSAAPSNLTPVHDLSGETRLGQIVSVDARNEPLGVVLARLSKESGATLTASRLLSDQRVTLYATRAPLHKVMRRVQQLLSHAPSAPDHYFWAAPDPQVKSAPFYTLERDADAKRTEAKAARDEPLRKTAELLRDWRDLLHMTPEEQKAYEGDLLPVYYQNASDPFSRVVASLTDAQIASLASGRREPLPSGWFKIEAETFRRKQVKMTAAVTSQEPPIFPPQVRLKVNDREGSAPTLAYQTEIALLGVDFWSDREYLEVSGMFFDTLNPRDEPAFADSVRAPKPGEPVYNLGAALVPPGTTEEEAGRRLSDSGLALRELARLANVSLYHEQFYKVNFLLDAPRLRRETLTGTLPQLLNIIGREWNFKAEKMGDDYLIWSRSWAIDRTTDIPERNLAPWRKRLAQNGAFTNEDRMKMAAEFSWSQVCVTLTQTLPESVPSISVGNTVWQDREYYNLRVQGLMTEAERVAAQQEGGVPLSSVSGRTRDALWEAARGVIGKYDDGAVRIQNAMRAAASAPGAVLILTNGNRRPDTPNPLDARILLPDGSRVW